MRIIKEPVLQLGHMIHADFAIDDVIEEGRFIYRVLIDGYLTELDMDDVATDAINDIYLRHLSSLPKNECEFYLLYRANRVSGNQIVDYELEIIDGDFVVKGTSFRINNKNKEQQLLSEFSDFINEVENNSGNNNAKLIGADEI